MADPIEVLLKFAFLGVLYLFLLWVARSALKDLRRPVPYAGERHAEVYADEGPDGAFVPSASRLVHEHGGGLRAGQTFVVGPGLVIGRGAGIDVQIEDNFASGRHARVFGHDGHVYLEDMNSTNGTYLNGRRVRARELLRADDRIQIGDTEFRFEP